MIREAILRFIVEGDDDDAVKDLLGDFTAPDWNRRPGDREVLYNELGKEMASSRNLRGVRQWVRQYPISSIEIKPIQGEDGRRFTEGGMLVSFTNGWHCVSRWSSYSTLKWSLRNWRNLYGARLIIDGQEAGKVGYRNPALWEKDYGPEPTQEALEDDDYKDVSFPDDTALITPSNNEWYRYHSETVWTYVPDKSWILTTDSDGYSLSIGTPRKRGSTDPNPAVFRDMYTSLLKLAKRFSIDSVVFVKFNPEADDAVEEAVAALEQAGLISGVSHSGRAIRASVVSPNATWFRGEVKEALDDDSEDIKDVAYDTTKLDVQRQGSLIQTMRSCIEEMENSGHGDVQQDQPLPLATVFRAALEFLKDPKLEEVGNWADDKWIGHWTRFGFKRKVINILPELDRAGLEIQKGDLIKAFEFLTEAWSARLTEAMEDEELGSLDDLLRGLGGISPELQGDKVWKQIGGNRWSFQENAHQHLELTNYGDGIWEARVLFDEMVLSKFTGNEDEMIAKLQEYGYMPGGHLHQREMRYHGHVKEADEEDDFKDVALPQEEQEVTLDDIKAAEPGFFDRKQNKFFGTKKVYKYPGNYVVVKNVAKSRSALAFATPRTTMDFVIYQFTRTKDSPQGVLLYKGRADDLQGAKEMIKSGDFRSLIDRYRHLMNEADDEGMDKELAYGPEIQSVHIVGRNWWRRGAGGNYYRADIYVNDQKLVTLPEQGGSEQQYLWDAFNWLEDNGYITRKRNASGSTEGPRQVADRMGFKLTYDAYSVRREREL